MITATIQERKVVKGVATIKRNIRVYKSMDKAKKELSPIAREMREYEDKRNRGLKVSPLKYEIDGVSYDTESEKKLLIEIGAFKHEESAIDGY